MQNYLYNQSSQELVLMNLLKDAKASKRGRGIRINRPAALANALMDCYLMAWRF